MIYCLIQAVDSGRWRWWAGFAAVGIRVALRLPRMSLHGGDRQFLWRWRVAPPALDMGCALATICRACLWPAPSPEMIYLQLMLPCVPQLMNYFKTERALGEIGPALAQETWGAHLLAGIPWNNSDTPSAGYQELQWAAESASSCVPIPPVGGACLSHSRGPAPGDCPVPPDGLH